MHTLEAARKYEKEYEVDADKRPLFHVTPPIGWMNDPNGFSVYKGQIHLFINIIHIVMYGDRCIGGIR